MKTLLAALTATTILTAPVAGWAATIYPLDRATILVASPFDVKVEFNGVVSQADVSVTINGAPASEVLGKDVTFIDKEDGVEASAVRLNDVRVTKPGTYTVVAKAGDQEKSVTWEVYDTPATPAARNVIFLIADGFSMAHRTSARIMSKGMTEGKADGRLHMDDLDRMATIGTSSTHSIATDSANTMSAYMTGHKSRVNALGVYAAAPPTRSTIRRWRISPRPCAARQARRSGSSAHQNCRTRPLPRSSPTPAAVRRRRTSTTRSST